MEDSTLRAIAEYIARNEHRNNIAGRQRESINTDYDGIEYYRQGSKDKPAQFYFSVSRDIQYFMHWDFKLILGNFLTTTGNGVTPTSLTVRPHDSFTVPAGGATINLTNNHVITPNPHTHNTVTGVFEVQSSPENLEIWIEGYNLTPYFAAQFPGQWPTDGANGVYPGLDINDRFDIIQAAIDYGNPAKDAILSAGYKSVVLRCSPNDTANAGLFNATLVNYMKYSHLNR